MFAPRSYFLGGRALIGAATRLRQSDALDQQERWVPRANSSANVVSNAPSVLVSVGPVLAVWTMNYPITDRRQSAGFLCRGTGPMVAR